MAQGEQSRPAARNWRGCVRLEEWTDEDGYKRAALLRDDDPEPMRTAGIPVGPPDLSQVDWDVVQRELHNQLYERRLFTWEDVQRAQNGVTAAVLAVLKRRVIELYRGAGGQGNG